MMRIQSSHPHSPAIQPLSCFGILAAFAILLCLSTANALGTIGPVENATNTTTESTKNIYLTTTTSVTDRVDDYATTIIAKLANGTSVFDQTEPDQYSSSTIQAEITAADAILKGDGETFSSPIQESTDTALQSSVLKDVDGTPTSQASVKVTTYIGPATIDVGPNQSQTLTLAAGDEDIDTLVTSTITTPIQAITTDTYLTSQTYVITGSAVANQVVPLPSALWQGMMGLSIVALLHFTWLRRKSLLSDMESP